jgi:hypothetical protein
MVEVPEDAGEGGRAAEDTAGGERVWEAARVIPTGRKCRNF